MRNYYFTFKKEEDMNNALDQFYALFKGSKDYNDNNIILCKVSTKPSDTNPNPTYKVYMSIADTVNGSFGINVINTFNEPKKIIFYSVKADLNDVNVELPGDVMFASDYTSDPVKKENKDDNKKH